MLLSIIKLKKEERESYIKTLTASFNLERTFYSRNSKQVGRTPKNSDTTRFVWLWYRLNLKPALYQDVLYAVKKRDQSLFEDCLTRDISGLPETYTTTLRTFKKFLPQIQNALHYSYSNGPLECLNNHIKVLKRNAYGFRNFYNFKLRIMIRHGKTFLTK